MTHSLRWGTHSLSLEEPLVMGIVNATPNSFFDGGRYASSSTSIARADELIAQGARALDFGGCSTQPGAVPPTLEEEWKRVEPAIQHCAKHHPNILLSIDTYRGEIVHRAAQEGIGLVNDISAGRMDPTMLPVVARWDLPYVLMHMQGTPATMQLHPTYENVTKEVLAFLQTKHAELNSLGVRVACIDLGFGFGKTREHNFTLLRHLADFHALELPLLVGISRKSMIYKSLNTTVEKSLNGTSALHAWALDRGAKILRVHDVTEAIEVVRLHQSLMRDATLSGSSPIADTPQ